MGKFGKAKADYNRCIEYNKRRAAACYNSFAWLLATCPESKFRDGNLAIQLGEELVRNQPNAYHFGTLAAAYAENGKFDDAVTTIQKAISISRNNGDKIHLAETEEQLEAYKSKKPWREK